MEKSRNNKSTSKDEDLNYEKSHTLPKFSMRDDYAKSEWRRIEFKEVGGQQTKKMSVNESNFEREVSHLNRLQQRNEHSL